MSQPLISVVLVNWNSGDHLNTNIASMMACNNGHFFEIVVVDNHSTDGSLAEIGRFEPMVRVFRQSRNLGFGAAANIGWQSALGSFILFLNPDITHTSQNLSTLARTLTESQELAGVCGRLQSPSGRDQRFFQLRRLPSWKWLLMELFIPVPVHIHGSRLRRHYYADRDWNQSFDVEQPAAACWMLRREVCEAVGGFDPQFYPAWFEDVDLAKRLYDRGLKTRYVPESRFVHSGGYSVKTIGRNRLITHYWHNAYRYIAKHDPAQAERFRKLIPVAAALRWCTSLFRPADRRGWADLIRFSLSRWK